MSIIKDLDHAVGVFGTSPKHKEDLEYLVNFLSRFEDLRRYLQYYSMQHQFKVAESFQVKDFAAGEVIFRKGHTSSLYYFVLDGQIEAYNEERDGKSKLVGIIGIGKQLGEIGILRNQPRSLTCIAKTNGIYLVLPAEQFMSLIALKMVTNLDQKIKFIENYFPNVKKLTTVQKQRIAYAMGSQTASRGQSISVIGEMINYIYFISEGELMVSLIAEVSAKKMILKLAPGNLIGEECVFFNSALKFDVRVSSEYTQLYTLQKQDIYFLLPPETIEIWKQNFKAKDRSRQELLSNVGTAQTTKNLSSTFSNFKQASRYASKRLDTIQKRNEKIAAYNGFHQNNLLISSKLKQYSPAAVLSQGSIIIPKSKRILKLNRYVSKTKLKFKDFSITQ